jgi:hypothetical protein
VLFSLLAKEARTKKRAGKGKGAEGDAEAHSVRRGLRAQRLGSVVGGHDAHKASTRWLHARTAYVMRVGDGANLAYATAAWAV